MRRKAAPLLDFRRPREITAAGTHTPSALFNANRNVSTMSSLELQELWPQSARNVRYEFEETDMTREDDRIPVIAAANESGANASDAETKRLAAFLMVVFTVLLGVLTWFSNEISATHASSDTARAVQSSRTTMPQPASGQGIAPEEHIQAF